MVKALQRAIDKVATLPEADQEEIAQQLLAHVEKLSKLRADIDAGIRSLDAGKGKPIDIDELIAKMNKGRGRS